MRRSNQQDDYLLRLIQQAGEALRRLRQRLRGGEETPAVTRRDAAAAVDALLGAESSLLGALDATTAVRLVGDPRRVAAWAALLELDAEAAAAAGDGAGERARRARAESLRDAARAEWGEQAADD